MNREGVPFVAAGLATAVLFGATWYVLRWEAFAAIGACAFLFALFCIFFFRDPERTVPRREEAVVSPADGKVVEITTEDDPHVGSRAQRVSIFLSLFDVHITRIPVGGRVIEVTYRPGRFLMAFAEKASRENEQTYIAVKNARGVVAFRQIAGFIARRVVCTVHPGDRVRTGQRCGLIRFGSRVDVILPPDATVHVRRGEHVRGGETVIGVLP